MASAGAVVGATDQASKPNPESTGSLLAAALAIPGLLCALPQAHAEAAPDKTTVGVKYLKYRDWQPFDPAQPNQSGDRIHVSSPSVYFVAPVSSRLSVAGSAVYDSVSGASPYYHNTLSGASQKGRIDEVRKAAEIAATWYGEHVASTVGISTSREHDYQSDAASVSVRINTAQNNRTWEFGASTSHDRIDAVTAGVTGKKKDTTGLLVGVTQVLTPKDLVQANLTYSDGRGYFSDPYKNQYGIDIRPDRRRQWALLVRYNHYFDDWEAALRLSGRYYKDSFGIRSTTATAEWEQPVGAGFSVVPSLRYTTQRAASFYYDPPFPSGAGQQPYYSADTRLSAFGAVTYGVKIEKAIGKASKIDLKFERYEQRSEWRLGGGGSPGLLPFYAQFWQVGWSTSF